jgi:hypothetical protein
MQRRDFLKALIAAPAAAVLAKDLPAEAATPVYVWPTEGAVAAGDVLVRRENGDLSWEPHASGPEPTIRVSRTSKIS